MSIILNLYTLKMRGRWDESTKIYMQMIVITIFLEILQSAMHASFKLFNRNAYPSNVSDGVMLKDSFEDRASESESLKKLIKENYRFKQQAQTNMRRLMDAVQSNNITEVKDMLQSIHTRMDQNHFTTFINSLDNAGYSALHRAAEQNNYKIMELLLENGANPNIRIAVPEIFRNGVKIAHVFDGATPLHILMQNVSGQGEANLECFALMLEFNPNLNVKTLEGDSLFDVLRHSNNPNSESFEKVLRLNNSDYTRTQKIISHANRPTVEGVLRTESYAPVAQQSPSQERSLESQARAYKNRVASSERFSTNMNHTIHHQTEPMRTK